MPLHRFGRSGGGAGWEHSVSSGDRFGYRRGDDGLDEDTSLYDVPLGLILDNGNLRFRLGGPLLVVDGPTRIVPVAGRGESRTLRVASMRLAYDWLEASDGSLDDAHEIAPFLSFRLAERWDVGPYAVFGLSDGSPDYGGGVTVSFEQQWSAARGLS